MTALRRVGIVGVGNMGGGMAAACWTRAGGAVCDIVAPRCGAGALGAQAAARGAGGGGRAALIVCVVDAAQAERCCSGRRAPRRPAAGRRCCCAPPSRRQDVERSRAACRARPRAIDAPMSGGPARARDGRMSLMVACDDAVSTPARADRSLSRKVFRIGTRPGDGARTKLVNNLLAGINLAGAAEAHGAGAAPGAGPRAHAGRDRAVQRPELDRLRPHAAGDRGRLGAACPRHACCRRTPGWRWRRPCGGGLCGLRSGRWRATCSQRAAEAGWGDLDDSGAVAGCSRPEGAQDA
jgi:3-hydroxyisobutyrate dehydrogenase